MKIELFCEALPFFRHIREFRNSDTFAQNNSYAKVVCFRVASPFRCLSILPLFLGNGLGLRGSMCNVLKFFSFEIKPN